MRKAFDANVPKFRPRLRNAVAATELQEAAQAAEPEVAQGEEAAEIETAMATSTPNATASTAATAAATTTAIGEATATTHGEVTVPPSVRPERSVAAGDAESKDEREPEDYAEVALGGGQAPALQSGRGPAPQGSSGEDPALQGGGGQVTAAQGASPQPSLSFDESPDVHSRRERLLAVKRKVAAAARPAPPMRAPGRARSRS